MHLIGTATGAYKVGTLQRKPDGAQWSADLVLQIVGSPQQPEPGVDTRRVSTFAKKKLANRDRPEVQFHPPTEEHPVPHQLRIQRKDVEKY